MHLAIRTLTLVLGLPLTACATDVKGNQCGLLDTLYDSDGDSYCPDDGAPEDCADLNDALVDAAVVCGDGAFTEEELRAGLEERNAFNNCDNAVATSTSFDECLDVLTDADNPPCAGSTLAGIPDSCVGAVLTTG